MKHFTITIFLLIINFLAMAQINQKPPLLNQRINPSGNIEVIQPATPPPPPGSPLGQNKITPDLNLISQVLNTANQAKNFFKTGKIWAIQAPGGEIEIKGAIIYENNVVATIHFNPQTGGVLPEGYNTRFYSTNLSLEELQNQLAMVIQNIKILNGAEYRDPEACWAVPLSYNGLIVAHLKIYYDALHIVPDYPAQQEMNMIK